jgi:hypothetical protein
MSMKTKPQITHNFSVIVSPQYAVEDVRDCAECSRGFYRVRWMQSRIIESAPNAIEDFIECAECGSAPNALGDIG